MATTPAVIVRLNLSRDEYTAFRHYCIDRGESGAAVISDYIRRLLVREKKQLGPGVTEGQGVGEVEQMGKGE
jgi:hypothetical protein